LARICKEDTDSIHISLDVAVLDDAVVQWHQDSCTSLQKVLVGPQEIDSLAEVVYQCVVWAAPSVTFATRSKISAQSCAWCWPEWIAARVSSTSALPC